MKNILLLNPAIGTDNIGDYIIHECVCKEMAQILRQAFVREIPTQMPAFHSYAIWKNSFAVQNFASCDYKFIGGSNILAKDMRTHYPQWNVNIFNCKPLSGSVCVGVGAGAGEHTDAYTTHLYRKILSHSYYHSVRDERSKRYVEDVLGLKAINTGCVTMWALQLPLAWTLGNAFGATGIYAAMLCANAGSAFWYARLYAGKKWLEYGMRKRQNA